MREIYQWVDREKFKEIFRTHWESFKAVFSRYRASRYDEVIEKMLGCGDPKNGYATYIDNMKRVGLRCINHEHVVRMHLRQ